ncbi:Adhesion G-protein coupled receptor G4 [Mytilus edulis]|uniref:Adhesion G-protein coupled receptor G4 n=1 Tax=Mytilus edulis TaxID=6550 RepID=A0A8S3PN87_MYTED|nr:Adhesion G-protein coupled receptor G4 [Mytilus edulis]
MIVPAYVMRQTKESNVRLHFIAYRTSAFFLPEAAAPEEVVLKQRTGLQEYTQFQQVEKNRMSHYTFDKFCYLNGSVPSYELDEVHDKAMIYISYIGCAVSIFGLAVTIVTYSMFRSLNREKSSRILLNMCVSMLLMNVAFLMMAETTKSESSALCTTIAILLHYFLLTSLMWMLTEAINMYHALITVFTTYSSQFILRRCVIAWGIPLLVVAITMGVNKMDNYNSKTDFYLGFGPVAINESKVVLIIFCGVKLFARISNIRLPLFDKYRSASILAISIEDWEVQRRRGPIPSTTDSSSSSKALHDSRINNCSTIDSTVDTNSPQSPRNSVQNGNGQDSNGFSEYDKNKNKQNGLGVDNFTKI